jgi:PAS domain S-box-containing protein
MIIKKGARTEFLHIIPPVLAIVLAAAITSPDSTTVFEPVFLLPLLNTVLLTALPFTIAYLAARSFVREGPLLFLLFGSAMVAFGTGSLLAGWGGVLFGTNFTVTVHNSGALVGGICHLGGVAVLIVGHSWNASAAPRSRALVCAAGYAAATALLLAVSILAARGSIPTFFTQDNGPTRIRQIVLSAAVIMYALSGIFVIALRFQTGMRFLSPYAIGLILTAIGLGIVMHQSNVGTLFGWLGRIAQYGGSGYFIAALVAGRREFRSLGSGLPRHLTELFRAHVESEVRTRTHALAVLNAELRNEAHERRLAEEELRLSEERLRLAAEATGFGVYSYAFETGTAYYSPQFMHLFGLPPGPPLPLDADLVANAVHPEDRAAFLAEMTRANDPRGSGILDQEYRILRADGEVRWLRVRGRTSFLGSGGDARPFHANGITQDITERKLDQENLALSEQRLSLVLDATNDGIWDWRIPTGETVFSPRYYTMLGYRVGEFPAQIDSWKKLVHPEDLGIAEGRLRHHIEGGSESYRCEFRMRAKTGEWRWVLSRGKVVERGPDGQAERVMGTHTDITELKLAEQALRESETKFRASFMAGRDARVITTLEEGRVVEANDALLTLFGYSRESAIGRTIRDLGIFQEDFHANWLAPEMRSSGEVFGREMNATAKNGHPLICTLSASTVHFDGMPHILGIFRDITEMKRAERELISSQANLRKLAGHLLHAREEERRKIAQEIHDDLGQILTALKMDLHWVAKRLGPGAEPVLEKVEGSIELADQTISIVQRISSELRPRMLDDLGLAAALEWLGRDFTRRTGIPCTTRLEYPEHLVGGNAATAFYRIAQEALTNVVRHAQARHVKMELRQSGNNLLLSVQDDGIGISPARASDPRSFGLIGLRERGHALGGSMSVEGTDGHGTLLCVTVPLPAEGGLA